MQNPDPIIVELITELDKRPPINPQVLQRFLEIGSPAIPYLIEALKREDSWFNAAEVLSNIGQAAVEPLIATLKESPYGNFAFHALYNSKEYALSAFLKALEQTDVETRMWAITGLADIQDDAAFQGLTKALMDSEPFNRRIAIQSLAKRKEQLPLVKLRELEAVEENEEVKAELQKLLLMQKSG